MNKSLNDLLDKYEELARNERLYNDINEKFEYIENPAKQNLLTRRLQKLLGRYGYLLDKIEYKISHDTEDDYNEEFILTIKGNHKYQIKQ